MSVSAFFRVVPRLKREANHVPTYEYKCQKCGKAFDASQKMTDKPLSTCIDKTCKGQVKRLIGRGGGFIFKGSGFYATDYRSKDYKKREKEDRPKSEAPCSSCDKKKDCNPQK